MTIHWKDIAFHEELLPTPSSMSEIGRSTSQKRTFGQSSAKENPDAISGSKRPKYGSAQNDTSISPVPSNPVEILSPIEVNYSYESNPAVNDSVASRINFIDCDELASLLTSSYSCTLCVPLILDIRSLAAQANLRIQTAVGIPCESRVKLRRALPMLTDFLRARKQCFNTHSQKNYKLDCRLIIICADSSVNEFPVLKDLLHCLVKHLTNDHDLDVRVLKGGFQEFCNAYEHLCEHPLQISPKATDDLNNLSRSKNTEGGEEEEKFKFSLNVSIETSKCTKQVVKYSQLLLPGLGIPVNIKSPITEKSVQPVIDKQISRFEFMNINKQITNPFTNKWGLSQFCLNDNDPGDPKAIFRAQASRILPFLYLGNESDSQNETILRKCGINYILNVTLTTPFLDERRFKCHRLPATDSHSQDLRPYFNTAFQIIEEVRRSGKSVLVHCQAGVSRSPALIIAYLMAYSSMSLLDAYQFVKTRRSVIAPNFAFMGQLFEFESDLTSGRFLRQSNILDPLL
uniref:protein-tyrosine-phosphatase n=1 Tax=Trichobilharzia regenti TaxID=157069 RepID=A0AA85JYB6_TRIRE|nr:unnamed protein product [Trichobilharzia regenti]